jgi:hypothetical protein
VARLARHATKKLGTAYNGVISITQELRKGKLDDEGLVRVWREWVPNTVEPISFPG